jgi:ATP-dependent DNA ligase
LSDRPPSGPEWLHEIKFDGYRVIARKDGARVRVWARTTSDYTAAFTRIRETMAALPAENAVIDGEAVLVRADGSFDFEGLRSRHGQAGPSWSPMTCRRGMGVAEDGSPGSPKVPCPWK